MSFAASLLIASLATPALHAHDAKPFTLQQVLSAPFARSLTAAPAGNLFAWVEDAEGRHNLWIAGPNQPARALTHNTADDAQNIAQLVWSPDAAAIAYSYGAEPGADGATEYNDVLAAANYLHARSDVDPKRIGIWGGSYGGYLTALALARNSDLFAAGVDFHGVHDWNLEDNASDWKQGSNAEKDTLAARARASSPIAAIDHWRSPVLFIHGDNDPEIAYAQTPVLADALRARNVHVEELIFPDELHNFLLHRDWLAAYQAAAAFFEKTLKP